MNPFYRLALSFLVLGVGFFFSLIFFYPRETPGYWAWATTGTLIAIATILGALGVIADGSGDDRS